MAHEVETMFSAREIPWHRLGNITPSELTADEAIKAAGLDWTVELETVYAGEGEDARPIDLSFAVVRQSDRKPLGVVGPYYRPMQNEELFEFADALLDTGEVTYETAGSLRGGRTVWILARVGTEVVVQGDETIPYLLITNSHDGQSATRAMFTPTRVVCANTLAIAQKGAKNQARIPHTSGARARFAEARETLQIAYRYYGNFEAEVQRLIDTDVTDRKFQALMDKVFPMPKDEDAKAARTIAERKRDEVRAIYRSATIGDFAGTGWGALNAFNEWELWAKPVRGGDDQDSLRYERMGEAIAAGTLPVTSAVHAALTPR